MAYAVVPDHNNEAELVELDPQPATPDGILFPEVTFYGSGSGFNGTPFVDLVWTIANREERNNILAAHGMDDETASAYCTATIRKNDDTFANANVLATNMQRAKRGMRLWRGLVIRYSEIEWLPEP